MTNPSHNYDFDVAVVTSAALPWRTGPAFLSLWHACGLNDLGLKVAYVIPWLPPKSQKILWGEIRFATPKEQSAWLEEEAARLGCPPVPKLFYYQSFYFIPLRSIIPSEDIFSAVPNARVILLEEAEHLCWFPPFIRPRARINAEKVIGLLLTNYQYFIRHSGWLAVNLFAKYAAWRNFYLIRGHSDLVVPLSPAIPVDGLNHPLREARITGVLAPYRNVPPVQPNTGGVYFLGRLVWDKGLETLIEISCRMKLEIDVYGDGPDADAIKQMAKERGATLNFLGPSSSPWQWLCNYRLFINPSLSEVLCTATADSLVAGRHVVLPNCPANRLFLSYPNAHGYDAIDGAVQGVMRALHEPPELPDEIRRDFDWGTACRALTTLWE